MNSPDTFRWLDPATPPLRVCGLEWFDRERRWRRLPANPPEPLPPAVDGLANNLAGGQIRFRTDATTVRVRVRLAQRADMDHMPAVGQAGVDFYVDGVHPTDLGFQRMADALTPVLAEALSAR
jgi:lysophospholipase L1-like esterase